jgi:hypothetical protein
MSRCQDVKMSRCQDVKMSRCQDVKMSECQDVRMSRCQDADLDVLLGSEDVFVVSPQGGAELGGEQIMVVSSEERLAEFGRLLG